MSSKVKRRNRARQREQSGGLVIELCFVPPEAAWLRYYAITPMSVTEIEMPLLRPEQRGRELTPSEMDAAGALLGEPLYVCTAAEMYATATWESM